MSWNIIGGTDGSLCHPDFGLQPYEGGHQFVNKFYNQLFTIVNNLIDLCDMEEFNVYTQSDFARRLGRTKQCVSNAIRRHIARSPENPYMEFESVVGERIKVRLKKAEGSKKQLICIVAIYELVLRGKASQGWV